MSSDDWFRNTKWDESIERIFFEKIKKARSQKTQYLKIQSGYLIDSHPDVVLRLAKYARNNCPDEFWEQDFCLYESQALYNMEEYDDAVKKAYESIAWRIKKPSVRTEIPYWLAKLVLLTKRKNDYTKCLELLRQLHSETPFPSLEFNFHGYSALLFSRLGEASQAHQEAVVAISWANKDENLLQNKRKKKYGIFREKNGWPYDEIFKISRKKA